MNLYLRGIGGDHCPIQGGLDSLAQKPSVAYEMVLTNPPFGKKSWHMLQEVALLVAPSRSEVIANVLQQRHLRITLLCQILCPLPSGGTATFRSQMPEATAAFCASVIRLAGVLRLANALDLSHDRNIRSPPGGTE
jgi:hypothetical protein